MSWEGRNQRQREHLGGWALPLSEQKGLREYWQGEKNGCCYRVIAKDIWDEVGGTGSCAGEGGLSKMAEFIIETFLRLCSWRRG